MATPSGTVMPTAHCKTTIGHCVLIGVTHAMNGAAMTGPLLHPTAAGLYCPIGDFYIDPTRPVKRALITHGHGDHARPGHAHVLATAETLAIMAARYGDDFADSSTVAEIGATITIGEAAVGFHHAGHVLGSAQISVAAGSRRIVTSGDYKRQEDPTCAPFQVIPCDTFITEATFGLPIFKHPPADQEIRKLTSSVELFPDRVHLVGAYGLGKAQRLIALLRRAGFDRTIYLHGAMVTLCALYQDLGIKLGDLEPVGDRDRRDLPGALILCPPGALQDLWSRRFGDAVTAFASGWMRTRARARQRGVQLPLVISDHGDWDDLTRTIVETGAEEVWVTHGQEDALVHWCRQRGLRAQPLNMVGYSDDGDVEAAAEAGTP